MDGTNLNTGTGSGSRPTQNWTVPQQPGEQPLLPPAVKTGPGAPATTKLNQEANAEMVESNQGAETTATIETGLWTDVVTNTPVTDANITVDEAVTAYVTYSDRPNLSQSKINDPEIANKALNLIQNPTPETQKNLFLKLLTNTFPNTNTPEVQAEYANVVVTDPEILKLAEKTGTPPGLVQKNVNLEQNAQFSAIVSTYPEDIANKLTFAHFVPEGAKNLSPELKAQLASIEKQVQDGVANAFGFAEDWTGIPADATEFLGDLTSGVDYTFEKLLDAKVADGSLSSADAQTLKSMHYGHATGTPTLKNLLITLQNQATANLHTKFGMDANFHPKADVAFYNNVVNGDFTQTYQKNVAKYTGTANAEQKALLAKYASVIAANPKDPSIPDSIRQLVDEQQLLLQAFPDPDASSLPDNLKEVAKKLIAATKGAIIEKYGLDANWSPSVKVLMSPTADVGLINRTTASLQVATEVVDKAKVMGESMPSSPEKEQFLAFLQVISKALGALQDSLYAMQAGQSNAARNANRGKLDLALNDLEQQKKAAEKSEANVKKMISMGPAGKAIMWIVKIIILLVSIWFGPAAVMLAMALIMDQVVSTALGEKKTGLEKLMNLMSEKMPSAASAALKLMMVSILAVVSPWLAIYLFSSDAHIVEDIMKSTGANEQAQAIAAMVINMALMLAIMIPVTIITGGASGAIMIGMIAEVASSTTVAAATTAVKIMAYLIQQLPNLMTLTMEGIKMNNNILLSFNDIIKGESEAYSEKLQGIIKLMKQLIAKLMEIMSGTSANIVSINEFQGSKWNAASQISSEIAG